MTFQVIISYYNTYNPKIIRKENVSFETKVAANEPITKRLDMATFPKSEYVSDTRIKAVIQLFQTSFTHPINYTICIYEMWKDIRKEHPHSKSSISKVSNHT